MAKNNPTSRKTSLPQRIALILFGLSLTIVILEIILRLGGFIILSIQEYKNLQSIKEKGSYRIMCLGESTTQNQYPSYLEEILNQRNTGVKFRVIDKGKGGTNTTAILSQLEANLDTYHPDMVVTMMGCNDDAGVMYYKDIPEANTGIFQHCRLYRFGRIIYMHIANKLKEKRDYGFNNIVLDKGPKPENMKTLIKERNYSENKPLKEATNINHSELLEKEDIVRKSIKFNPENTLAYAELRQRYKNQSRLTESEQAYKNAIEFNPKNDSAYAELGRFYRGQNRFIESEQAYKKAIELNPKNGTAYAELGWLYCDQSRFAESEQTLKRAIELNPRNDFAYLGLGCSYEYRGRFAESIQIFEKAIELNPKSYSAYLELGQRYACQGRFIESEQAYKKALEIKLKKDIAYGALGTLYGEMNKPELSKEYHAKADELRSNYINPTTLNNYLKLKQILDKRNIRLVCVQYPMRSLTPLKNLFKGHEDPIFVDNEKIFKDAIRKQGYKEYFIDMFAGDFGHCTQKGNSLLAKNIVDSILKKYFTSK